MSSGKSNVLKVCVSGAAGNIGYSLLRSLATGDVFGRRQKLHLTLLDIKPMMQKLQGTVMELVDCGFPLLADVTPTDDYAVAFKDIDYAILLGGFPRRKGMTRAQLLGRNAPIFQGQGAALNKHAKKTVKVLVVANPANSNCLMARMNAPDLPAQAWSALTRLDGNRARAQVARKAGVSVDLVKNIGIWGNHSKSMFPDLSTATVGGTPVTAVAAVDEKWAKDEFVTTVQYRGKSVIDARGASSAMSAANAVSDHMRTWHFGTKKNEHVPMAVVSDGNPYGVAKGLIFSFPVTVKDKSYSIVPGIKISKYARGMINATQKELKDERKEIQAILKSSK